MNSPNWPEKILSKDAFQRYNDCATSHYITSLWLSCVALRQWAQPQGFE